MHRRGPASLSDWQAGATIWPVHAPEAPEPLGVAGCHGPSDRLSPDPGQVNLPPRKPFWSHLSCPRSEEPGVWPKQCALCVT